MPSSDIQIIECPRDAMQGIHDFIPTEKKVRYINQLLKCGFHTVDCGSFVSPRAVPQMADTAEVISQLEVAGSESKLLVIVANERGAEEAVKYSKIDYLGFPLSLSETFQKKNTNRSISEAFEIIENIQDLCIRNNKQQVVYLSMGFGNPYGDPYDKEYIVEYVSRLKEAGITIISPSDTVGVSDEQNIKWLFSTLIPKFPEIKFGAHLHSTPGESVKKITAAWGAGCRRFDGALKGFGGCPMAREELTGNIATEKIIKNLRKEAVLDIHEDELVKAESMIPEIFPA